MNFQKSRLVLNLALKHFLSLVVMGWREEATPFCPCLTQSVTQKPRGAELRGGRNRLGPASRDEVRLSCPAGQGRGTAVGGVLRELRKQPRSSPGRPGPASCRRRAWTPGVGESRSPGSSVKLSLTKGRIFSRGRGGVCSRGILDEVHASSFPGLWKSLCPQPRPLTEKAVLVIIIVNDLVKSCALSCSSPEQDDRR